ncbi:hypothetical protein BDW59DRAFT_160209 [Aspergillus cavernicola]|uniref:Uncharacterized protein n=1 Tax=Aspergillus cavernicola TaxID=176166 RepID=A0ABR4IIG6_9EURO
MVGFSILPFILLFGFSAARVLYPSDASPIPWLGPRQDETVDFACEPQCELNSCAGGLCTIGLTKRDVGDWGREYSAWDRANTTAVRRDTSTLVRRIFRYNTNSNRYNGRAPTRAEADVYLPAVLVNNREDDHFGAYEPFFDGTEAPVMIQRTFGNEPFQLGTGGLHGCTMVAVISRRAVWMAHFWEVYSHSRQTTTNPASGSYRAFRQRIIDAFKGVLVVDPVVPRNGKPYRIPVGDPINPDLFNEDNDGTHIIIMTPNPLGSVGPARNDERYHARHEVMVEELRNHVGGDPRVDTYRYSAYNYAIPREEALANTERRGMCLFQYDTDSDGQGMRAWRLLYEQQFYSGVIE